MRIRPILTATAGIALTAATLAGCSAKSDSAGPSTNSPAASSSSAGATMSGSAAAATGSAGDIAFAQLMIPHHEQAIQMADLAATNASSTAVKALAAQVKAAQGPEITMMTQWLSDWGAPTAMPSSSASDDSMGGMDMGGMGAAGMMSTADMNKLGQTTGAAFDKMWLQMMLTHHQGAISMARQVAETTTDPAVKGLAGAIIEDQAAEIATMRQLLAK